MNHSFHFSRQLAIAGIRSAIVLAALGLGQAQATTFDVNLTGNVGDGNFSSFDSGGTHYDQWILLLSGLDSSSSISAQSGDTINATITLDQSVTIPASVDITAFALILSGASFPSIDTGTSGTTSFFNQGVASASGGGGCTTSGQLASCVDFFPPDNTSITFDTVTSNFTISALGQPVTLDNGLIYYTLFSPSAVPEPESYAMMMAGLGLVGAVARRKKSAST